MRRVLPLQEIALAVCLLVGCSESETRTPTAPDPQTTARIRIAKSIGVQAPSSLSTVSPTLGPIVLIRA